LLHYHIDRLVTEQKAADNVITFDVLFKDPECEQTFESIIGTMKAGRTAKFIDWKGQMLLHPTHKDVKITLLKKFDEKDYDPKVIEDMKAELARHRAKAQKAKK